METENDIKTGIKWWIVITIFASVIGIWRLSWVYIEHSFTISKEAGPFGDTFGFVNSLFSGLAFAGIIITILLQRKELEAQRIELKQNTKALNAQKEEFEKQNKNLVKQTFESSFFNSLNAKDTLVSMLNERQRNFFEVKYGELDSLHKNQSLMTVIVKIRSFFSGNEWLFGHYFRSIIIILKLIDKASLKDESKAFYISVLQARMSNDELRIFLYYIISELKGDQHDQPGTIPYKEKLVLREMMKKYDFFQVIRTRDSVNLIDPNIDWEMLRHLVYDPIEPYGA